MYEYKAEITNVVDGDTYDMDIDLGFHTHIHERVRVLGLDTPEKRGSERKLGEIMTKWAEKNLLGETVVISSKLEINPKTDSFGRWLVDVFTGDGRTVTEILTAMGVNKYSDDYSEENVRKLEERL